MSSRFWEQYIGEVESGLIVFYQCFCVELTSQPYNYHQPARSSVEVGLGAVRMIGDETGISERTVRRKL